MEVESPGSTADSNLPSEATTAKPLAEVVELVSLPSPDICVICLDLLRPQSDSATEEGPKVHGKAHAENPTPSEQAQSLATALPCNHSQFHFPCLGTWLTHSRTCPLCKVTVHAISLHHDDEGQRSEVIPLPEDVPSTQPQAAALPRQSTRQRLPHRRRGSIKHPNTADSDPILAFRRTLYDRQIPSLYRGRGVTRSPPAPPSDIRGATPTTSSTHLTSPSSRFSNRANHLQQNHQQQPHHHRPRQKRPIRPPNPTPASFHPSNPSAANLTRLATIWIRRELSLFPFLNPTSPPSPSPSPSPYPSGHASLPPPPQQRTTRRRQTTAPHLLTYTLSILQQIDLSGSAAQAVVLLAEYLGEPEARLFVHELKNFLGSGVGSLREWDEEVALYWFDDVDVDDDDDGQGRGQVHGEVRDGIGRVLGRASVK